MKSNKLSILFVLYLFVSFTAYGQVNVKDSILSILQNDTVIAQKRFVRAFFLISRNSLPEEAEELCTNVVFPFVKKNWKNKSDQLSRLAQLNMTVSVCYRERGGDGRDEKERNYSLKAIKAAKESGNDTIYSYYLTAAGYMEIKRGDIKEAHKYLYQAIEVYDKMKDYVKVSELLYVICSNFFEIKDTDGIQRILRQMEECLKKDNSKQSLYQYNVIKKTYFEMLLEKEKSNGEQIDCLLVDTVISAIRENIYLVENHHNELSPNWLHGWAYYYLSKALYEYYPEQTDGIFHYLDKASEVLEQDIFNRKLEANAEMELKIYIYQLHSQTLLRQGKTEEAYKYMNESLLLLDKLKGYQNLNEQRYIAHKFMSEYYENKNCPAEALKYYKLLHESEEQRYEHEKVQAINDMSAKYETEKKETQIRTLIKEKSTAQRILWLTVCLAGVLLIALLLFIRFYKLRKKSLEQSVYESVLLAELRQNELEQKKEQLRQQLEQKPTKIMIEKLTGWISQSVLEKSMKDTYIRQLSGLDIDMLEQGYLTADEKISGMDMKYIICFAIDMDVKNMSLLFNVEPASIRTVRYRIKKKFKGKNTFKFLM